MLTRSMLTVRLRVAALVVVLTATSFVVTATPVAAPAISGGDPISGVLRQIQSALAPKPAKALACATTPSFNGYLTSSSASTTDLARTTTGSVYGYISLVGAAWSCTAYIRYSALAWNVNSNQGVHNWGNLINSTSVPCNWVVGETNYLKQNSGATCHTSDAQFAMNVSLTGQRVYQADLNHDSEGDIAFEHSDCTAYYGANPIKGSEGSPSNFLTTNTANRPGANCDPNDIDSFGGSHTTVYDGTAPAIAFGAPAAGGPVVVPSAFYTVGFNATDALAGFGGANGWTLQRQVAAWSGSACGTFANDTATGNLVTGTTNAANQTSGQSLLVGKCYQWILDATDQNGNSPAAITSGSIRTDTSNVLGQQSHFRTEGWDLGGGDSLAVSVGSGNVVISHPIVSLPIRGSAIGIDLTYNSQDAGNVGFGPGWRLNVQRRLSEPVSGGPVTFTDSDGSRHTFTVASTVGTVTTYTRPAILYATLVKDTAVSANEFVLTYRDLSKDKFDILGSEGVLVRAEDRYANGVTVAYIGGTNQISTISDTAGSRPIDFAYDGSNRLTSITDWAYLSGNPVTVQTGATGSRRATRFFYDASSNLSGWADGLNTSGSCPTGGSHLTCLTLTGGVVSAIGKTQAYETLSAGALGSATRTISTTITYAGSDVTIVKDAEQVNAGGAGTAFSHPGIGQTKVVRPGTPASETNYTLASATDSLGRITSLKRKLGATWLEQLTAYDATYPTEPASVTENNGALLSTPARTTSWTYVASSLGLVSRITEPLTASTNRTTDFTYNANNDVTQKIVALDGSATIRTITRSCYDASCTTSGASTLTMSKQIENYVDGTKGGPNGHVEDVTTEYLSDDYGRRTRATRFNYAAGGTLLDSRSDGLCYSADCVTNNGPYLLLEIANYVSGEVTSPGDDITPNATTNARTDLTTAYTYDTAGNRVTTADPRRAIETAKGTSLGADDFISRSTYDALSQQLTEKTPTTPGITITCAAASPNCRDSTWTYDEFGAVRQAVDFGNLVTASELDRAGRATRTFEDPPDVGGTKPADTTSETTYDQSGRVLTAKDQIQVDDTTRGYSAFVYDELGRQLAAADAVGTAAATETDTGWDALDRQVSSTVGVVSAESGGTAAAQTTVTTYDSGDRVTKLDDEFTCTSMTYDWRDLPTQTIEGQTSGTCSGGGLRTIVHTRDGLGRLTKSEITADAGVGDKPVEQTYDSAGRVLTSSSYVAATTTTSTLTSTYNLLDQGIVESRTDGSIAKTIYDPVGNQTDRCYWAAAPNPAEPCQPVGSTFTTAPTRLTSATFDARNNRVSLTDASTKATTIYDPDHNYLTKAVYVPTKMTGSVVDVEHQTTYAYDERHRLTGMTHQVCTVSSGHSCSATTGSGSVTYEYDFNDNRTRVNENNGSASADRRYCYDPLDRLQYRNTTAACSSTAKDESYAFDDGGNRTQTVIGGTTTNYAYDTDGQLCRTGATTCGTPNVTYDSAGRTATYNGFWYTYDADGRLLSACKSATCLATADRVEMVYDGEGRRTKLITTPANGAASTREFRYQGDAIVEEWVDDTVDRSYLVDESGSVVELIIPGGVNAGTYLVTYNGHGDALGLWRIKTDGSLELANSFKYKTWGEPEIDLSHANSANGGAAYGDLAFRFLYVGEFDVQWDASLGLAYMHARHYSPILGRFLQPDPDRTEPNLYAYAANNPVSEIDPDGTCFIVCVLVGAVIDSAVYLATTDNADLGGLARAVVGGAVESAINPFAKIGKVTKLVSAAQKVYSKFSKASRFSKTITRSASSCARHSFDAETLVTLADGTQIPISDVEVGDEVLAWNQLTGVVGAYPVSAVWTHDDSVTGLVVIDGEAIATTPGHPFYVTGRGWVDAEDLRVGDEVPSAAGDPGTVGVIRWDRGPDEMYDLTVAVAHTYFVGDGGWLVHNCSKPRKFTSDQDALIQIAKDSKVRKRPISERDARILDGWRRQLRLPGHKPMSHTRHPHLGRHINVGPVRHIRISELR